MDILEKINAGQRATYNANTLHITCDQADLLRARYNLDLWKRHSRRMALYGDLIKVEPVELPLVKTGTYYRGLRVIIDSYFEVTYERP